MNSARAVPSSTQSPLQDAYLEWQHASSIERKEGELCSRQVVGLEVLIRVLGPDSVGKPSRPAQSSICGHCSKGMYIITTTLVRIHLGHRWPSRQLGNSTCTLLQ